MAMFIAAFVAFTLAITGMSVGVMISNRRLKGSCGGLNGLTNDSGQSVCSLCSTPSTECTGQPKEEECADVR